MAWSNIKKEDLIKIKGVCLDIDETLSTRGKLTAHAYSALWKLKEKNFAVVPITGRPAGWCDHMVRFWPVDAVVGENGAFSFFMQNKIRRRLDTISVDVDHKNKLSLLSKKILASFPFAKWASDQAYREFDLAIDVCEDVPPWKKEDIQELLQLCHKDGAHAKLSSIHVNVWYGDYDKLSGFKKWLSTGAPGLQTAVPGFDEWLFVGDSPNDEPLFSAFKFSVGVANLKDFLDCMTHYPCWITTQESGAGFCEVTEKLITN
ncbi:MAG: HAD-IIB family hydrolase [Deltaproteobacteria bacterium]|nr:HAD-IIB family hydrolase [Deltaproteobacteria bacterium]